MNRRTLIKRLTVGVMAAPMLWDALTSNKVTITTSPNSAHFTYEPTYGIGFQVSQELIENDIYGLWLDRVSWMSQYSAWSDADRD